MSKIKRIDVKEFRDKGFLQEANRLFFHPLGLALETIAHWPENVTDDEKTLYKDNPVNHPKAKWTMGGVWDYRNDPEGMLFAEGTIDKERIKSVKALKDSKIEKRAALEECNKSGIQQK